MEQISITTKKYKDINIEVKRKSVKTVRLKVFSNCDVAITVPVNVSANWIEDFLYKKSDWIDEKLSVYNATAGVQNITELKSGMSIKFFGIDTIIIIVQANKKNVVYEDDKIYIYTLDLKKSHIIKEQLESFMKSSLLDKCNKIIDSLYSIIKKEGCKRPSIYIRKMKTMWGNCNPAKDKITINLFLYQASGICIEYVILHELLHFIHPNHSQAFYNLLSLYMPDWKARKTRLDYEVVTYVG